MRPLSVFCSVGVLALGLLARADEPRAGSQDALDAARRDLQNLHSADPRTPAERELLRESAAEIPEVGYSTPAPSSDSSSSKPSQGWLLDALLPHDKGTAPKSGYENLRSNANTSLGREANPLNKYVEQWLTPQSRSILKLDQDAARNSSSGWGEKAPEYRPLADIDTKPLLTQTRSAQPKDKAPNPYLVGDSDFDRPWNVNVTPSAPVNTMNAPVTGSGLYSGSHDDLRPQKTPPPQQDLPAPNAPLINDDRYFPQLRRF